MLGAINQCWNVPYSRKKPPQTVGRLAEQESNGDLTRSRMLIKRRSRIKRPTVKGNTSPAQEKMAPLSLQRPDSVLLTTREWGKGDILKYFNIFWHQHKDAVRGRIRVRPSNPHQERRTRETAGATPYSYHEGFPRFLDSVQIWSYLVRKSLRIQNWTRKSRNIRN